MLSFLIHFLTIFKCILIIYFPQILHKLQFFLFKLLYMPSGQNVRDIFQTNQVCFVPTRAFQPLVLKPVQDRAALQEEIENPTRDENEEKGLLILSGRQLLETNKQSKMTKRLSSLTWSQNVEPGRKLVVSKL